MFGAGSVCFPNRWDLRSKLGLPLRAVHQPVSLLNDQLGETIDRFFDRLTPERSFWRLGWGVLDSVDLYQPLDGTAAPRPATPTPADLVVRVERETLRRLPRTGCVLFTIRTHLAKATELAADPRHGPVIAEALAAMPPTVRQYKQVDRVRGGPRRAVRLTPPTAGAASWRTEIVEQQLEDIPTQHFSRVGTLAPWPSTRRSGR